MRKFFLVIFACVSVLSGKTAKADYLLGCNDPNYHQYTKERFSFLQARSQRSFESTLRDYQQSLTGDDDQYWVITNLSRHLRYSGQFDPINKVEAKIERIFEHANDLTVSQQIAGDVLDSFSDETHSVGIAKAWIAYRQGKHESAFDELLKSIEVTGSPLLSSFGPDFEFVRHIYREGHVAPTIAYINKTSEFWTGRRPDELRATWRTMIEAGCKIQFDLDDKMQAVELGLKLKG